MHGHISKSTYQGVISQVDKRVAGWKSKCLSLAGRITLIMLAICAIPAYMMQTAKIPRSICDDIDRKIKRFLWGGTGLERRMHLALWALITQPLASGRLGIHAMRPLNATLLMKIGWQLITDPEAPWA